MIGCLPLFTVRWPMNPKRIPPITFNWSNFNQNDCWKKKKSILNDDESIVMTCESLVTFDLCCGDYDATDSCQGFRWKLPGFKPGSGNEFFVWGLKCLFGLNFWWVVTSEVWMLIPYILVKPMDDVRTPPQMDWIKHVIRWIWQEGGICC